MTGRYTINPEMPVLLRPDGAVQVGWDPRRAVLIQPPRGLDVAALATVLRSMRSPVAITEVQRQAARHGLADPGELTALISALLDAGAVRSQRRRRPGRAASVRIHGQGPLSELLLDGLRCSEARTRHSRQPHAAVTAADTDLVVLADYLVADPRMVRELHAEGVAHLAVRVRDGVGLVGPLVIPGVTSCLGCADLHRSDRDAAWPAVAAQLRGTVGSAGRATVLATAALALGQVNRVIAAVGGAQVVTDPAPPATLNATLEFDPGTGSLLTRHWVRHPLCPC
jgi:bacteriocin biosynthesis cyclodehydratase domain-containing protein